MLAVAKVKAQMESASGKAVEAAKSQASETQLPLVLRTLSKTAQTHVTKVFARQVVVASGRTAEIVEDPGFRTFIETLLQYCQAQRKWIPPTQPTINKHVHADSALIWQNSKTWLNGCPPYLRTDHHDCWTDRWKRHWALAYTSFLDEDFNRRF